MSNLNHSVGGLVGFDIAIIAISAAAVALRFWSRGVSPNVQYSWDDWLALAALPPTLVICSLILDAWRWGLGTHGKALPDGAASHMLKDLFVGNVFFDLSISLSKISAMAFYGRIFRVRTTQNRAWRWSYYVIMGLAIAWPIASIPYTISQCTPVQKYWDNSVPGACYGQFDSFVSSAISSVIIDIMILILPLPQIFQLQMSWTKKLLVMGTLIVGYSAAFMSIGRLVTTAEVGLAISTDPTFAIVPTLYWSIAECGLSVLAVCLPAIFQLCKRCYQFGPRSLFSSRDFSNYQQTFDSQQPLGRGSKQSAGSGRRWHVWRSANSGSKGSSGRRPTYDANISATSFSEYHDPLHVPLESIHVRSDVKIGHQMV